MRHWCARAPRSRTSSVVTGSRARAEGDDAHELLERRPQVARRGRRRRWVRRGEEPFERDATALEHVDDVERLRERDRVGPHGGAERGSLLVGDARDVDHELLGEGHAHRGAGVGVRITLGDRGALELLGVPQRAGHRDPDGIEHGGLHRACGEGLGPVEAGEGVGGVRQPGRCAHRFGRYSRARTVGSCTTPAPPPTWCSRRSRSPGRRGRPSTRSCSACTTTTGTRPGTVGSARRSRSPVASSAPTSPASTAGACTTGSRCRASPSIRTAGSRPSPTCGAGSSITPIRWVLRPASAPVTRSGSPPAVASCTRRCSRCCTTTRRIRSSCSRSG